MFGNQILVKSASNIDSHIINIIFFSSSTKKSYSLLVNSVLGASVAMNKRFYKFTCDNWFRSWVLASFIFEKNLLTHAMLRGKINRRWHNFKQLGKIIAQALSLKHVEYNLCASKEVSEPGKVCLSFSFLQFISFIWNFSSYIFQTCTYETPATLQLQLHHQYLQPGLLIDLYVFAFCLL